MRLWGASLCNFPILFDYICVDQSTTLTLNLVHDYLIYTTMVDNNSVAKKTAIEAFQANMYMVFISMFALAISSYADLLDMSSMSYVVRLASAFVLLLLLCRTIEICLIF